METLKEKHRTINLDDIKKAKPQNNFVVCKRIGDNINSTTPAGIYKTSDYFHRNQWLPQNVERVFEIVSLPEELTEQFGFWKTTIEAKVGDKAIVSYHDSLNSMVIIVDEQEYRLINYYNIITLVRRNQLIPINGYILFTQIPISIDTSLVIPEMVKNKLDVRYGKIRYIGKPNEYYTKGIHEDLDKNIDIKKNDTIIFIKPLDLFAPELEHPLHRTLKSNYRYTQRYMIGGKIS